MPRRGMLGTGEWRILYRRKRVAGEGFGGARDLSRRMSSCFRTRIFKLTTWPRLNAPRNERAAFPP